MDTLTPTTAKEWREKRNKGVEIVLPQYGDVVSIRPMDAQFFFQSGRMPSFLSETMRLILSGSDYTMPIPSVDEVEDWLQWLDELIKWTFVSPKVVNTPQNDNEISIDEIGYEDKLHVYRFFGRPAQVLRRFRDQQIKPLAIVDAAKNNGHSTEQVTANTAVLQPIARDA